MSNEAVEGKCAHNKVSRYVEGPDDSTVTREWWECNLCGTPFSRQQSAQRDSSGALEHTTSPSLEGVVSTGNEDRPLCRTDAIYTAQSTGAGVDLEALKWKVFDYIIREFGAGYCEQTIDKTIDYLASQKLIGGGECSAEAQIALDEMDPLHFGLGHDKDLPMMAWGYLCRNGAIIIKALKALPSPPAPTGERGE